MRNSSAATATTIRGTRSDIGRMVAMRFGAVSTRPMGSCGDWHLRVMARGLRAGHHADVPTAAGTDHVPAPLPHGPHAPLAHAPRRRSRGIVPLLAALLTATLLLGLSSTGVLAATTMTPKCDAGNLRTGPSTTYTKKTSVNTGTMMMPPPTPKKRRNARRCTPAWYESVTRACKGADVPMR